MGRLLTQEDDPAARHELRVGLVEVDSLTGELEPLPDALAHVFDQGFLRCRLQRQETWVGGVVPEERCPLSEHEGADVGRRRVHAGHHAAQSLEPANPGRICRWIGGRGANEPRVPALGS